jgi:aarF domain-containing kinase
MWLLAIGDKRYETDKLSSYRTTLNARETTADQDEQENMLKACHKRCAERTLVVLEKNGGIFIKLGQHLV